MHIISHLVCLIVGAVGGGIAVWALKESIIAELAAIHSKVDAVRADLAKK